MKIKNFVLAASILLGAGGATLMAAQHPTSPQISPLSTEKTAIAWQPSFEAALAASKSSGKPVMVDFGATWCGACKMMEEQTYPDANVIAESKGFVMVRVDVDKRSDLANRYGIASLPTTAWLRADGKPISGAIGALDARALVAGMHEATRRAQKTK